MSYIKGLKDCLVLFIILFIIATGFFFVFLISKKILFLLFSILFLLKLLFVLHFFRNPDRKVISDKNSVLSPADGKIISITTQYENLYLKSNSYRIVIFMNIFNVHRNRIPVDGVIKYLKYIPGKFFAAFKRNVEEVNERTIIGIQNPKFKILFKQIAGLIARRIVCNLKLNNKVKAGQIFGMIKFGSAVIIYIPEKFKLKVKEGQKVYAGISILASLQ